MSPAAQAVEPFGKHEGTLPKQQNWLLGSQREVPQ
jgi:hypothetical protein